MPSATPKFSLAPARVGVAIVAGALSGGVIVTIHWLNIVVRALGPAFSVEEGTRGAVIVFMGAFLAWLAGLILIGGPVWWLLHRHHLRGWQAAALAAFVATFAAGLILAIPLPHKGGAVRETDRGGVLIENDQLTAYGWLKAAEGALLLSFVGAAVGLVVWRVAYRQR